MATTQQILSAITGMQRNTQQANPVIPNNGNPGGANNMPQQTQEPEKPSGPDLSWLQPSPTMQALTQQMQQRQVQLDQQRQQIDQRKNDLLEKAADTTEQAANAAGVVEDAYSMYRRVAPKVIGGLRAFPGLGSALGAIEGSAKSFKDVENGDRDRWMQATLGGHPSSVAGTVGADSLRVLENIGNALTFDLAGKLGDRLSR